MLILKQSTAIDIRMGPFVDSTDGVTPETGITLGAADQAEVLKSNGAATVAMGGTFAAVTGSDGWYDYTVATGDVDTVGEVVFVVQDSSVCLPVFTRAYVVEEAVYDAMYGSSAAGPLQSTVAGRTADITAGGTIGIDWGNIENPTTTVDLSATDINLCDTITTYTGNTVQTGDSFARLGAPAGASVSADIADVPTVSEFNARTLLAADYFDPATDTVANVTTVATTTTNADMRGTDSALLASSAPTNFSDMSISVTTGLVDITQAAADKAWSTAARTVTAATNITSDGSAVNTTAGVVDTVNLVNTTTTNTDAISVNDILTTQMTEAYAADGVAPTLAQALFLIQQTIGDFSISGTTITTKQLDGSTTAATYTLDDGTSPTSRTRAT